MSRERRHPLTHQAAEGLRGLEVAPPRDEMDQRVAQVAAGGGRRPVRVLGMEGAYVPSRPESARGRRPGQARHRAHRARWQHEWREAKGGRFSLLDGERIVHGLSGHQVDNEQDVGKALPHGKDAGVIPEETVRLWGVGDGAAWRGKHGPALLPHARQGLDSSHGSAYLPKGATAQYGQTCQAVEGVAAPLTRLDMAQAGPVLGGLRRLPPTSEEARKALDHCWVYLNDHRSRTAYGPLRRGGSPLGRGGMESANTFICHVRLKRSGAWWYEDRSHQMLALRCAKYNGTVAHVFRRSQCQKADS